MLATTISLPDAVLATLMTLGAGLVGWTARRMFRLQETARAIADDDQVDQVKDELIDTLERNHTALEARVKSLEVGLDESERTVAQLSRDLRARTSELEALKPFTAPAAILRLQGMFESNADLQAHVLERLAGVEEGLSAVLSALAKVIEKLPSP